MIDSHCHLADEAFAGDLDDVIARARDAGLARALCILSAGEQDELDRAARVNAAWDSVRFAIGVHPHNAHRFAGRADEAAALVRARLTASPQTLAIGEIGLDYHYDFSPRDAQRDVFVRQLALARELQRPVIIHTREADDDTFEILRQDGRDVRGVFHCFTGDRAMAARALDLGFHLSFSGIVTFAKADSLREVAAYVPDDRFLIETDAPYLAPPPHRGKRNEPAWVVRVAEAIATVRGTSADLVSSRTDTNFIALFGS
jgi:TatD DNase family protein